MSIQLLEAFGAAWNAHDLEALLSMVTDDCVFETAAGAEVFGNRFVGKAALREAFPMAWITWPDAQWADAVHYVSGDRGVSEWTFLGTDRNGKLSEGRGVDLFELRGGLIARKDTYRKVRNP
jgi:ketosteroid isomerase-like protein